MTSSFLALYAWVTLTQLFPPIEVGTYRGVIKTHDLPCVPAVMVSSSNPFIRPWVARVDADSFALYIENLGIPGTPVTVTAHAFCFGHDPALDSTNTDSPQ